MNTLIRGGRIINPASGGDTLGDISIADGRIVSIGQAPACFVANTAPTQVIDAQGCIVMHPGPINRGVEIDSAVADGPHSVILQQVTFGIAVRMAAMSIVAGHEA